LSWRCCLLTIAILKPFGAGSFVAFIAIGFVVAAGSFVAVESFIAVGSFIVIGSVVAVGSFIAVELFAAIRSFLTTEYPLLRKLFTTPLRKAFSCLFNPGLAAAKLSTCGYRILIAYTYRIFLILDAHEDNKAN
jgi:hypothetical protein